MSPELTNVSPLPSLFVVGAGYVGAEVVRQGLAQGWRVVALTRNAEKAAALRKAGCATVIEADLATNAWHVAAAQAGPFNAVINCVSSSGGGAEGYRRSYLDGTASLMNWLTTQSPGGTIVYTSSTGVYPQGEGVAVDESSPAEGRSETGRILREAESALGAGAAAARWRWFVLRLAGIYGPGRHGVLDQLRAGVTRLGGDPDVHLNLIHRDDAASAALACVTSPQEIRDEVFNVSDNSPATRGDFAGWLAVQLGAVQPMFDPAAPVRPGANPSTGRTPAPNRVIVAQRIRERLHWAPRYPDFRAGYAAILAP